MAWGRPCAGVPSSAGFSLGSCSHSGISGSPRGFPRSVGVSFLFGFGVLLAWSSSGLPVLSSTVSDAGTGEMSLLSASSLSRTEISPTEGEDGEDEDDEHERLSCFIGVSEVDEDTEEELDKPGTTIGTKFSELQIIRIPSFMRCGF